ncbi:MAG TPA: hypothetical protein PLY92_14675, partial [Niabella sp.]|nr:hypothetical protein [Niabella sp.]HRC31704.1 hypothetical protein [Niabella sp.]
MYPCNKIRCTPHLLKVTQNYNRLSYNSAFPWQADSVKGVVSMNYIFKNAKNEWEPLRLYDFKKFENGIYYRDAVLETNPGIKLQLADIPLPNGILRIDHISSDTATAIRLGHYALPKLEKPITTTKRKIKGHEAMIIDNGQYQLAIVNVKGWEKVYNVATKNVHPQSKISKVLNLSDQIKAGENKTYITLMLWKKSGEKWSDDELLPIRKLVQSDDGYRIYLNSGELKNVEY